MKKILIVFVLLCFKSFGQRFEGQNFCEEVKSSSYFPLDIESKKMFWYTTFYVETNKGKVVKEGKEYFSFEQKWNNTNVDVLLLREENGKVVQYDEKSNTDFIRFDNSFKVGQTWMAGGVEYKIITYDGELKTPYCNYKGLMVMEAKYPKVTYRFYYLKGMGYVGATRDGKLVSCVTPE